MHGKALGTHSKNSMNKRDWNKINKQPYFHGTDVFTYSNSIMKILDLKKVEKQKSKILFCFIFCLD